ncbi:ALIS1 [Symbiodinium sp. KB8]|nr:ALIS1 [Symbiodinium sp. KB8]
MSFCLVGVVFVPVGFILQGQNEQVVEVLETYDAGNGNGACAITSSYSNVPPVNVTDGCRLNPTTGEVRYNNSGFLPCNVTLEIPEDMASPVYVYYELENFYQNHRRYVKSRDDTQLSGGKVITDETKLTNCDPLVKDDLAGFGYGCGSRLLHPCGLIANSMFNDTFDFGLDASIGDKFKDTDIAWETDVKQKFKAVAPRERVDNQNSHFFLSQMYPGVFPPGKANIENEHFIVWMRVAALPTFRKLYGRIEKDLKKGDKITVQVHNRFNVAAFKGKKSLVLSTTSFLGGKNPFLGIAYITVGFVCIALAAAFALKSAFQPRATGDTQYLQWTPARAS